MLTILIAEDNDGMATMLMSALRAEGYEVTWARDGREAVQRLRAQKFDLVVTDLKLPYKGGLDILQTAKDQNSLLPVIVMTAHGTIETAVKAVKDGAYDFLTKPFDPDHLLLVIGRALEKQRLITENLLLKEEAASQSGLPRIIGKHPRVLAVIDQITKVAASRTTVLLLGESGTGKELFARALHGLSPRREGSFVAINCAAIPKELLESELFGHERGSFTGATDRRIGKFELADHGTIFLDEIGDLDLGLQAKLLRVLEGEEFCRVGGTARVKIDVRVVAATNKDLRAAIAQQCFREDLFFRLSVVPITVPPLRDRREDIPALVAYFLAHYCRELKRPLKTLSESARQVMIHHPWTGNIRELQNCIERAVILTDSDVIEEEHLGIRQQELGEIHAREIPLEGTLHEVSAAATRMAETRMIRKVLKSTGGNKSRAAQLLGVSYKTLLTKIKDYKIERSHSSSSSDPVEVIPPAA
ncbi:MAG: sigma-54-dependent Fis family transcriptional regulator [Nitrospirae bacterium]|nr:sigma-54-dependent Fis family transcriptional regulator [Nitrospirota bacterium]